MMVSEQKPPEGSVAAVPLPDVAPLKQAIADIVKDEPEEIATESSAIETCPILEIASVCWLPFCPPKPSGLLSEKYATGAATLIGGERVNAFTTSLSVTVIGSLSGPDVGTLTVAGGGGGGSGCTFHAPAVSSTGLAGFDLFWWLAACTHSLSPG